MKYTTIVQVLARSSSKRLADKNIIPVEGHPLLAWSVRLATLLPSVDRVIVNTDSQRYADIAREYGADAPFMRPAELAGDKSSMGDVMHHAVWALRDEYGIGKDETFYAKLVTFLPTSPFRNVAFCERMIADLSDYKWVSTGVDTSVPWDELCLSLDGALAPVGGKVSGRASELKYFKGIGTFSGCTLRKMENYKKLHKLLNPIECLDIDVEEDLALMRDVVRNRLYDFGAELW